MYLWREIYVYGNFTKASSLQEKRFPLWHFFLLSIVLASSGSVYIYQHIYIYLVTKHGIFPVQLTIHRDIYWERVASCSGNVMQVQYVYEKEELLSDGKPQCHYSPLSVIFPLCNIQILANLISAPVGRAAAEHSGTLT